ncbi:Uncharacterised protein [Mycobacteroides abscessus subsp. abscessus]|nr:Uncharacterised protein [Mycobacteroides abscessus subsp. abscessus]
MTFAAHAQQMDIKCRAILAGLGIGRQQLLVCQCGGVKVGAVLAFAVGHGMHVAQWEVHMLQQCLPGLPGVAFRIGLGDVPVIAPKHVDVGPVEIAGDIA